MDTMQLFNSLKRGEVGRLYLFYGPEDLLIKEAVRRIKEILIQPGFEPLNLTIIDGNNATAQGIANAVETLPFMNEKRLVIVNDATLAPAGKKGFSQADMEALGNCLRSIPKYSCLIIIAKNSPDKRLKLVKAIKASGEIVEFASLKPSVFEKWIAKQFKDAGKSIAPTALKRFIALTGYLERDSDKTLQGITNEIAKIVKYCAGRNTVRQGDIEALAPENLNTNIFKLVDYIGARDIPKAFEVLVDMKRGGEQPVRVLFMVARQFRLLYQVSMFKEMGYSGGTVALKLQLPPFIASSLLKQVNNFTKKELKNALRECGETDSRIKGGRMEPWLALELLIAGLYCVV